MAKPPNTTPQPGYTKYKYPLTKKIRYKGYAFKQVGQESFSIDPIRKRKLNLTNRLKGKLRLFAPKDTGRLSRSYNIDYVEKRFNNYIVFINNKAWYFRFPYNHYKKRGKDFVLMAVKEWIDTDLKK